MFREKLASFWSLVLDIVLSANCGKVIWVVVGYLSRNQNITSKQVWREKEERP